MWGDRNGGVVLSTLNPSLLMGEHWVAPKPHCICVCVWGGVIQLRALKMNRQTLQLNYSPAPADHRKFSGTLVKMQSTPPLPYHTF